MASLTDRLRSIKVKRNVRYLAKQYFNSLPMPAPLSPVLLNELNDKIESVYQIEIDFANVLIDSNHQTLFSALPMPLILPYNLTKTY